MRTALEFSSFLSDVAPPDPIPNSEVKRVSADNTWFARSWEDKSKLGNCGAVFSWGKWLFLRRKSFNYSGCTEIGIYFNKIPISKYFCGIPCSNNTGNVIFARDNSRMTCYTTLIGNNSRYFLQ